MTDARLAGYGLDVVELEFRWDCSVPSILAADPAFHQMWKASAINAAGEQVAKGAGSSGTASLESLIEDLKASAGR